MTLVRACTKVFGAGSSPKRTQKTSWSTAISNSSAGFTPKMGPSKVRDAATPPGPLKTSWPLSCGCSQHQQDLQIFLGKFWPHGQIWGSFDSEEWFVIQGLVHFTAS